METQVTNWYYKNRIIESGKYDQKISFSKYCDLLIKEFTDSFCDFEFYVKEKVLKDKTTGYNIKKYAIFKKERSL